MLRVRQPHSALSISGAALSLVMVAANPAWAQGQSGSKSSSAGGHLPSPARGYLAAHEKLQKPMPLLGGPLSVHVTNTGEQVFVALPDERKLDPVVFGTPSHPLAVGGKPVVEGVPLQIRAEQNGAFTHIKQKTPFGDASMTLQGGKLEVTMTDATAADAATSKDQAQLDASWRDQDGNTYAVKCCSKMVTVGDEHPTFGGVVTNTILHGFSRIGTPLMPSEFAYAAFWGMGQVLKNGKETDGPREVHVMLTEQVRGKDYQLVSDPEVDPTKLQLHIIVAPVKPGQPGMVPVDTGFSLKNGEKLPFWHVMFEQPTVSASRQTTHNP